MSITLVAGTVFMAWLVPPLQRLLPTGWDLMKANTAGLMLLCVVSIVLEQPRRPARSVAVSRALGACIALVSAATFSEYLFHISVHLDTLLSADAPSLMPGRMSFQTALAFIMLGIVLGNLRARKRALAWLVDALTLGVALIMLIVTAGYMYGALDLFGMSMQQRLSPQTLFCFILLTFVVFNRRTEYGVFSILVDDGIGGKTARLAAPCAFLLPFLLSAVRGLVTRSSLLPEQYAIAVAAALLALISFCFILLLSIRCKSLEAAIRELSTRDELTRLYNRRGFYLLAEQALRLAYRSRETFFLIFIDVDNLKQINDGLGHEVGSKLLHEMATLLQATFREVDVIGRLGGDEFVVAGKGGHDDIEGALTRLADAAQASGKRTSKQYSLSFSLGHVTTAGNTETLDDLLKRADSIMYESKRSKKSQHENAPEMEIGLGVALQS
ncbi:MAG TPA: GGDEF domain-containing protein [Acidobacteriaceae bacterium]|nr:GGDEF domain-containing protein [Acidobacteriaceae bacterium]